MKSILLFILLNNLLPYRLVTLLYFVHTMCNMDDLNGLALNFKLWFSVDKDGESEPIFGEHKIQLLKQIEIAGSISAAASMLGLDYKKAHDMIDAMNLKVSPHKLVISERGRGKGTHLTRLATELISVYDDAIIEVLTALSKLNLDSKILLDSGDLYAKIAINRRH